MFLRGFFFAKNLIAFKHVVDCIRFCHHLKFIDAAATAAVVVLHIKVASCSQLELRIELDRERATTQNQNTSEAQLPTSMLPALPSQNSATHTHHHVHFEGNSGTNNNGSTAPKRNSSMIFRIEHLLPLAPTATPTATPAAAPPPPATTPPNLNNAPTGTNPQMNANGTRRLKNARAAGVYLKQFAPKDTFSDSIGTLALMSTSSSSLNTAEQQLDNQRNQQRTYCSIMQGVLRLTASVMRRIKLSEDIHSYNALFEAHNGDVRLRIVRDIARDEELIAWFDEEVTILMAIPFLTPLNIQGNNRYTCHICQLTFETPNPLKIHLALSCGRHTLDILWIRLHYALKSSNFQLQQQQQQHHIPLPLLHHHLPSISPAALQRSTQITCASTTLTTISPISSSQNLQRFSAFKPISPSSVPQSATTLLTTTTPNALPTTTTTTTTLGLPLTAHSSNTQHAQFAFLPALTTAPMSLLQTPNSSPLNAAAQIEAIVSNMGASKQGHLCIYCGKVYSRKYGLKIHIRTHTGFKPLKCRYCLRPFGDPSNLNKHVRLHLQASGSAAAGSGAGAGGNPNETIEGYKCHLCHKTLARRRDLQRHIESRHNNAS